MTPEQQAWVDSATYKQLLQHWRFAPVGDPMFSDLDAGEYFANRMRELRSLPGGGGAHIRASKEIGWD